MPSIRYPLLLVAGVLCIPGCADFQFNLAVNSTAAVLKRGSKSLDEEPDPKLARDALPGTLKTLDSFLAAAPEQPVFLELVAQAYSQYAFAFLEDDLESMPPQDSPERRALNQRTTGLYDRAVDIGLRLADLDHPGVRKALKGDLSALDAELAAVGKPGAAGLYWAGLSMGSAINLHRDDVDRFAELPKAVALLERAHTLEPTYQSHGAALALGVVYASQGKAVGGNPERAKQMFDEVISSTGGKYLMGKVLYARYYATVTLDRDLFEKTLKEVLATPATVMPEQRLANELAHIRAERYLKQAEDLF